MMITWTWSNQKLQTSRNLGMGRAAGTITAAAFLANAVGNVPWVHFDIAGTAWIQPSTKKILQCEWCNRVWCQISSRLSDESKDNF